MNSESESAIEDLEKITIRAIVPPFNQEPLSPDKGKN